MALFFTAYSYAFDILKDRRMNGNFFEPRSGGDGTGGFIVAGLVCDLK